MTAFEIAEKLIQISEELEYTEISEDRIALLNQMTEALKEAEAKMESIDHILDTIRSRKAAVEGERVFWLQKVTRLQKKAASLSNLELKLNALIMSILDANGGTIKSGGTEYYKRKTKSSVALNATAIEQIERDLETFGKFLKYVESEKTIDKRAIYDHLKDGGTLPFATLEDNYTLGRK